jgi:LuxR family maltose regulon positive regulatory protein
MARIRAVEGNLDGALDMLQEAEHLYVSDFLPNVRPIAAIVTRVWLAQGRLGDALGWVHEQGLSAQNQLSYEREFAHITLARVLLARSKSDRANRSMRKAIELLDRLMQAAEAAERTGSVIEILLLQALAHQAQGDIPAALGPLSRALALAEPEGYVRMFVDEGAPMMKLLQEVLARGMIPGYVEKLLAAFPRTKDRGWRSEVAESLHALPRPPSSSLVEPLSARERDVLRLLRTDLSGPEIARELIVSLSTLRTHTRNIYTKLGVTSRRAAIQQGEKLDLF